jgi:hypothetical protein
MAYPHDTLYPGPWTYPDPATAGPLRLALYPSDTLFPGSTTFPGVLAGPKVAPFKLGESVTAWQVARPVERSPH